MLSDRSVAKAGKLGIPEDKWFYWLGGASSQEQAYWTSERPDFAACPSMIEPRSQPAFILYVQTFGDLATFNPHMTAIDGGNAGNAGAITCPCPGSRWHVSTVRHISTDHNVHLEAIGVVRVLPESRGG